MGNLDLFHHTSPENADKILREKKMDSKYNYGATFFTTHPKSEYASSFGDAVVHVRVPEHLANIDDEFPSGERHYWVDKKDLKPQHFVGRYAVKKNAGYGDYLSGMGLDLVRERTYSQPQHHVGDEWHTPEYPGSVGWVKIEKLQPLRHHDGTQNGRSPEVTKALTDGFKQGEGWLRPLHLNYAAEDHKSWLAEGNHRLAAAKAAGEEYAPVTIGHVRGGELPSEYKDAPFPRKINSYSELKSLRGGSGDTIHPKHVLPEDWLHPSSRGSTKQAGMIDEFRWDQDAQNRREERFSGGNRTERASYYGTDDEGDAQEKRLNLKDYLKQRKAPKEGEEPWDIGQTTEYVKGLDLGERHGTDPTGAKVREMVGIHAASPYPDHFAKGYQKGWNSVNERFAVLRSSQADDVPEGLTVVAHVSGNNVDVLHCPFCGSGAVIARSDGTIECGYCTSVFTVQTQPQFNGMPQTVDGQPYPWPGAPTDPTSVLEATPPDGTNIAPGADGPPDSSDPADGDQEGDEDSDDDKPAFLKGKGDKKSDSKKDKKKGDNPFAKKSFKTANGFELPLEEYVAHLAITYSDSPFITAQRVAQARRDGTLRG